MRQFLSRVGVLGVTAVFLSANVSATADTPKNGKRPNIVLLLADDLGWTGLGCFGSDLYVYQLVKNLFVFDPGGNGQSDLIVFRRVDYDIEKTQQKILNAGLPKMLAERLPDGR